jgi:muramoyltetrapeptide carboxypeptidase
MVGGKCVMNLIKPPKLNLGDTIGIPCLSHVAEPVQYKSIIDTITRLGFKVKMGEHAYSDTYGYAASAEERGADFNALIDDHDVKMILFGGGESAVEVLPFIDYELIKHNPKIISTYSDGTSVLNMIHAKTGLVTYYGQGAGVFGNLSDYDWRHFEANFISEHSFDDFPHNSEWRTLHGGNASGILIGGYLSIFDSLQGNKNYHIDLSKKYILFLEDFERFVSVGAAATAFAFIEQSAFGNCIGGLLIGHYANNVPETYIDIFRRFGIKNNVPVVYCDDFGHGSNHGILPIGITATLDADNCRLLFL